LSYERASWGTVEEPTGWLLDVAGRHPTPDHDRLWRLRETEPVATPLLRPGTRADAPVLARVHLQSRADAMPWLPAVHDQAATQSWFAHVVLVEQQVLVAACDGGVVAFSALHDGWLEQLYVAPSAQGRGLGRVLLDAAKQDSPDGLRLQVFARNTRARRFYEAAGLVCSARGDGSENEEGEPECTYAWFTDTAGRDHDRRSRQDLAEVAAPIGRPRMTRKRDRLFSTGAPWQGSGTSSSSPAPGSAAPGVCQAGQPRPLESP